MIFSLQRIDTIAERDKRTERTEASTIAKARLAYMLSRVKLMCMNNSVIHIVLKLGRKNKHFSLRSCSKFVFKFCM